MAGPPQSVSGPIGAGKINAGFGICGILAIVAIIVVVVVVAIFVFTALTHR